MKDYEARLGKPFAHEGFVRELADLCDYLKLGLSEKPPEGLPPVAELAEQIKALREANTVEAAPERTVRKLSRAERPVSARIRERIGDQPVVEAAAPVPATEEAKPEPVQAVEPRPVVIAMPEPVNPQNSHANPVERRRERKAAQLRLF